MRTLAVVLLGFLAVVPACSSGGPSTVAVELREWAVDAEPTSVTSGEVTFEVSNNGEDPHELVVARSDLAPDALPTDDDGAVPEDEVDIVDEVEELAPGTDGELTIELEPGSYVLFCNLVEQESEDGETITEAHYSEGMRSAFEVS
jgi:uncharacterized cupredoxin-like copper-binding protein